MSIICRQSSYMPINFWAKYLHETKVLLEHAIIYYQSYKVKENVNSRSQQPANILHFVLSITEKKTEKKTIHKLSQSKEISFSFIGRTVICVIFNFEMSLTPKKNRAYIDINISKRLQFVCCMLHVVCMYCVYYMHHMRTEHVQSYHIPNQFCIFFGAMPKFLLVICTKI